MTRRVMLIIVAGLLAGVALLLWRAPWAEERVRIAGEEAALARATAESEFVLPAALDAARDQAENMGLRAFVVHRRGHRVFEYFEHGAAGHSEVDGGELASALLTLALHQPGDEAADAAQAAALVSGRIWLPLRAADAWLLDGASAPPRRCCIRARLDDWLRVADLVNGQGAYRGERVISPDAVRAMLAGLPPGRTGGDEPLLARDGITFDLQPGLRIWLAPRRQLTMLVWADDAIAQDTLLPNLILRGLDDASPAISGDISDLVPGH